MRSRALTFVLLLLGLVLVDNYVSAATQDPWQVTTSFNVYRGISCNPLVLLNADMQQQLEESVLSEGQLHTVLESHHRLPMILPEIQGACLSRVTGPWSAAVCHKE